MYLWSSLVASILYSRKSLATEQECVNISAGDIAGIQYVYSTVRLQLMHGAYQWDQLAQEHANICFFKVIVANYVNCLKPFSSLLTVVAKGSFLVVALGKS